MRGENTIVAKTFSEKAVWHVIGNGWRHLHGNFHNLGYSIEWHDFSSPLRRFDLSPSFHPHGVEICLNLSGHGTVSAGEDHLNFTPLTAGFYSQGDSKLTGYREKGQNHQFITIELSFSFLRQHFIPGETGLHAHLLGIGSGAIGTKVSQPVKLGPELRQILLSLRRPPVFAPAQRMWYLAKALEVASALFYQPAEGNLFCQRQKHTNQERVREVISCLREDLCAPPSLEELGRRVGCSHFYLSRVFTQEMGQSIFQYLRELRMERAAILLKEGKMNVTEVSMEVGYSSPSHFSAAFHEAFGCCPGLYPLQIPAEIIGNGAARKRLPN